MCALCSVDFPFVSLFNPEEELDQLGFSFEEPKPAARRIWSVGELVGEVRTHIEREYADVWVEGEISNFRAAPSGHLYFTLKDGDSQLPVVLFRRQALLMKFRASDGMQVLVRGRVSVYEQRGQMQLVGEFMEPLGAGSLQLAFEQLKERLRVEGLFDAGTQAPPAGISALCRDYYFSIRLGDSRLSKHRRTQACSVARASLSCGGAGRDGSSGGGRGYRLL